MNNYDIFGHKLLSIKKKKKLASKFEYFPDFSINTCGALHLKEKGIVQKKATAM